MKITKIKKIKDNSEYWDMSIPETHNYVLSNGCIVHNTGIGFSVERQFVNKMPSLPDKFNEIDDTIVFADSKLGWAEGYAKYIRELYKGNICKTDTSKIRDKGSRLKTFGGRASGPEPLIKLLDFTKSIFKKAKGRKLNSLECHDIVCTIASIVIVGGVRRSATISLSNLSDNRMAHAKDGNYFVSQPQRALANNSVSYTEKPDCLSFMEEWTILARSKTGERGIFNREGVIKHLKKHVKRRNPNFDFVINPCGEIILRNKGFCNLTEVVIRADDTLETLMDKVEKATILGCVQSTFTKFKFLRKEWTDNAEEERLLGVSLTGLRDHPILNHVHNTSKYWLEELKQHAIKTSKKWASKLNINEPTAVTTVKPSGCTSLNTAIRTTDGIKTMKDIFIENNIDDLTGYENGSWIDPIKDIWVYDKNNNKKVITKLFINGVSDVYDIEFNDNNIYSFTGNHKLKTEKGWERVDELVENDKIKSIKKRKTPEFTVDIEVEDTHSYQLSNGVVSHNTVSLLNNTSSGLHTRFSKYYIRRVRISRTDPLCTMMIDQGIPWKPENGETINNWQTAVFEFPIKSPDNAVCNNNTDAIEMLEYWKMLKTHWCEHNPSCFSGNEKFITDKGLKKFNEFSDNSIVNVLNKKGEFVPATIQKFNKQIIYKLVLKSGKKTKTIETTATHIWPVTDAQQRYKNMPYKNYKTIDLPIGKQLESIYPSFDGTKNKIRLTDISIKRWTIVDVVKTDRYEDVYCVNEPQDNHFVLDGNILTHNCTIFVKDEEWIKVGNWVYENWNKIGGLAFLPADDSAYSLPPYEKITSEQYEELFNELPEIDFSKLSEYEAKDNTKGSQELACSGNKCELS